jgi:hypothetical protein
MDLICAPEENSFDGWKTRLSWDNDVMFDVFGFEAINLFWVTIQLLYVGPKPVVNREDVPKGKFVSRMLDLEAVLSRF